MTKSNTPQPCKHTHHVNNFGRPMPCDAATPDSCRFKGNVHGSQEEVILEAENISYKRNQSREERLAKKALEKAEQQQQKATTPTPANPTPPKPAPKPATPKPTPVPKPPAKPAAPTKQKPKVKLGHTLAEGDKRVAGANGRSYVLPAPRSQEPQTEEEYLEELEKQRLFLNRARYVTTRGQKSKTQTRPPT